MKITLLLVLALIAVGCAEGEQEESASCEDMTPESPLEDLRTCAEQGYALAQSELGFMYATGRGVPEDDAEAVRWYRLAAEQGFDAAQSDLGFMYETGDGVPEDNVEAVRWYRLAAEQGYALAQSNLWYMYANGDGVPKDDVLAYMWLNLAAAQGSTSRIGGEVAQELKDIIEQRMSREQIAEAQRRYLRGC